LGDVTDCLVVVWDASEAGKIEMDVDNDIFTFDAGIKMMSRGHHGDGTAIPGPSA
jgi:hypothetical protein